MIDVDLATLTTSLLELQVFSLTLWAEARGEGSEGILTVGCIIRNRVHNPGWWGRSYKTVCLAKQQFSCWNPGNDPNHLRLVTLSQRVIGHTVPAGHQYFEIQGLAEGIMDGAIPDQTEGCDHYFSPEGMKPKGTIPSWAKDPVTKQPFPPDIIVGHHWCYRLGRTGKRG